MHPQSLRALARFLALSLCVGLVLAPSRLNAQGQAPVVTVNVLDEETVRLTWEDPAGGFIVQESDTPSRSGLWRGIADAPTAIGPQRQIERALPSGAVRWFFRLRPRGAPAALDYLLATQAAGGTWEPGTPTSTRASTAALAALLLYGTAPDAVERGRSALDLTPAKNFDDLARRTQLFSALGQDVTGAVTELLDGQSSLVSDSDSPSYPGHGWGLAAGFGSSTLDTALVRAALVAAGLSGGLAVGSEAVAAGASSAAHSWVVPPGVTDAFLRIRRVSGGSLRFNLTPPGSGPVFVDVAPRSTLLEVGPLPTTPGTWTLVVQNTGGVAASYSAETGFTTADGFDSFRLSAPLIYLARTQNADGGWGIGFDTGSHLMITAEVLRSLAAAGAQFVGPQILVAGSNWLLSHANADGGYSSEPGTSNVGETALVMQALKAVSPATSLTAAATFLRNAQQHDGSWGASPYLTAAVLEALSFGPQVGPIPGQSVSDPTPFAPIVLDNHVSDADNTDEELTWTVTGNSVLQVSLLNRVATVTYDPGTIASETLTFTATDPDGLQGSASATFSVAVLPPVDFEIARGGTASGSRLFGGAKAILDQTVAFTEQQIGVPLGVTYAFTSFVRESDTEFKVDFNITAGGGAPLGDHEFQVEYQLLDAADNTLGPLTGNLFQFRIRITP